VARERGSPDVSPLYGGLRHDGGDEAPPGDEVHWAGLPVNLDLVFSRQQRDKVYMQHLLRRRGPQLRGWLQSGASAVAGDQERRHPDTAESISGW